MGEGGLREKRPVADQNAKPTFPHRLDSSDQTYLEKQLRMFAYRPRHAHESLRCLDDRHAGKMDCDGDDLSQHYLTLRCVCRA